MAKIEELKANEERLKNQERILREQLETLQSHHDAVKKELEKTKTSVWQLKQENQNMIKRQKDR